VDSINQIETVTLLRGCCRFVSSSSPSTSYGAMPRVVRPLAAWKSGSQARC